MLVTLGGRRQILVVSSTRAVGLVPENGHCFGVTPGTRTWASTCRSQSRWATIVSSSRRVTAKGAALVEVNGGGNVHRETGLGKHQHEEQVQQLCSSSGPRLRFGRGNSELRRCEYRRTQMEGRALRLRSGDSCRRSFDRDHGHGRTCFGEGFAGSVFGSWPASQAIEGKTWNYPAIAGGRLLVRNANQMAAYNIAAK